MTDIPQLSPSSPLNMICLVRSRYADGSTYFGTGVFVGPNDVLTASHMVYAPELGAAVEVTAYAGYGYSDEGTPYKVSNFNYYRVGEGDGRIAYSDVHSDVALLTTSGKTGSWFGMSNQYDSYSSALSVKQSGYDSVLASMYWDHYVQGLSSGWVTRLSDSVWDTSLLSIHSGDSGSPVWIDSASGPLVIGVVSTQDWAAALDTAMLNTLRGWIAANDTGGASGSYAGTAAADFIFEAALPVVTSSGEKPGWLYCAVDGGGGIDSLIADGASNGYSLSRVAPDGATLYNNGEQIFYSLASVERVSFTDSRALALDDTATDLFRLYQAAFDRGPDEAGVGYWLQQRDHGLSAGDVANSFVASGEFQTMYGAAADNATFLNLVYAHVLGRAPDQAGMDWWINEMSSHPLTQPQVLLSFADSAENISLTASQTAGGVWYVPFSA